MIRNVKEKDTILEFFHYLYHKHVHVIKHETCISLSPFINSTKTSKIEINEMVNCSIKFTGTTSNYNNTNKKYFKSVIGKLLKILRNGTDDHG